MLSLHPIALLRRIASPEHALKVPLLLKSFPDCLQRVAVIDAIGRLGLGLLGRGGDQRGGKGDENGNDA
jgi:hypothetical protein